VTSMSTSMPKGIVSQSVANSNIAEGECCGEAVRKLAYQFKQEENGKQSVG